LALKSKKEAKPGKIPSAEDFSQRAVSKAVLSEALQHPTTLYPAALSMVSIAYMALVNLSPTSLTVALVSGLLSLASGIFHYFVRGESIAGNYIKELKERRNLHKEQQAGDIEAECRTAGFLEGEKEAKELRQAYDQLYSFLKQRLEQRKVMTAGRFLIMAEETYLQGLQLLKKALVIFNVLKQIDKDKLAEEMKEFEREFKAEEARGDQARKPIIEAYQSRIRSHEKRLTLYSERLESLEQLMAQCEVLEAALDTTYLEVVDLIDEETFIARSGVANNLERAVAAARRVEERLRQRESQTAYDDEIYARVTEKGNYQYK
jgi:hypothetical protein